MGRAMFRPMSFRARFLNWLFATTAPEPEPETRRVASSDEWSTHRMSARPTVEAQLLARVKAAQPVPLIQQEDGSLVAAMDAACDEDGDSGVLQFDAPGLTDALFSWFGAVGFISHQMCAVVGQHWLIEKACAMPAKDAVRKGYIVSVAGLEEDAPEVKAVTDADKAYGIHEKMVQYVRLGRMFGIRIGLFRVKSDDPKYYERPFNWDAVTPGSYEGVVMVDPYWCSPILDGRAMLDPASPDYYEPTWWMIGGRKYHKSHLRIFRTAQPADILKPSYLYGGIPLPQQIMERVYAAERTANEGPQLAMTKRRLVITTDVSELMGNQASTMKHMNNLQAFQDNYSVYLAQDGDKVEQHETSLADLDEVIMTQYQLVAAIARVPGTKLLGTTPKGFNSTGDYEEASYHEELETIQADDLNPLLEFHHALVLRSEIEPKFGHAAGALTISVDWSPLDSPTAEEQATTNKTNAERDQTYVDMGALDAEDVRNRIAKERDSGYFGLAARPSGSDALDDAINALMGHNGGPSLDDATEALMGGGDPLADATAALADG